MNLAQSVTDGQHGASNASEEHFESWVWTHPASGGTQTGDPNAAPCATATFTGNVANTQLSVTSGHPDTACPRHDPTTTNPSNNQHAVPGPDGQRNGAYQLTQSGQGNHAVQLNVANQANQANQAGQNNQLNQAGRDGNQANQAGQGNQLNQAHHDGNQLNQAGRDNQTTYPLGLDQLWTWGATESGQPS